MLRRLGGPCERGGVVIQVTPITLMVLLLVSSLREQPHHVHCLPLVLVAHCRCAALVRLLSISLTRLRQRREFLIQF